MNLSLKSTLIDVVEIGFIPKKFNFSGLSSSYTISEKLRNHEKFKIGVVKHLGEKVRRVRIGDVVAYHSIVGVSASIFEDQKLTAEEHIVGFYTGIIQKEKDYEIDMEKFSFTPNGDRLLAKIIEPVKPEGLDLAVNIKPYGTYEVVQVGKEVGFLKVGDRFIAGRSTSMPIDLPEGDFFLFSEKGVYGKIEK